MGLFNLFKSKKARSSDDLQKMMGKMNALAFPGGKAQIEKETNEIYEMLRGKISRDDAKYILTRTKSLLVIAQDKSENRIASSIHQASNGKLTLENAKAVYRYLVGDTAVQVVSGDGSSKEKAIVINATTAMVAVPAQYSWLESRYGKEGDGWTLVTRMYVQGERGERYTVHEIKLNSGDTKQIFFDVTASMEEL